MNSIYFYKYHKFLAKFRRTGRSLVSYLVLSMFLVMKGSAQTRFLVGHNHGASTTWERIATLPASTTGTGDMLRIKIDGGSVAASGKYTMQLHLGNRNGFYGYVTDIKGSYSTYSSIECYEQGDNSIEVYLKMADENWHAAAVECWASGWGSNPTLYSSPTSSTTTPSGTLVFTSATAIPAFYIQQSGNVGVGIITIPRSKLEVVSGVANTNADPAGFAANFTSATPVSEAEATISLESNSAIAANTGGVLGFGGRYVGTQYANWASIKGLKEDATSGNYGGYLSFFTRPNGGVNTERMRILSNGNVGIGTFSPSQKLEVFGPAGSPATSLTTQNGMFRLTNSSNDLSLDFGQLTASPYTSWLQNTNKNNLSLTYPLAMQPNGGDVGIGTINPLSKLQVGLDNVAYPMIIGSLTPQVLIVGAENNTSDVSLLRLVRPTQPSNLYPSSVDFKLKSYGSVGAPYLPKTQFTIGLKASDNFNVGEVVDVMTLRDNGNVGIGNVDPQSVFHLKQSNDTYSGGIKIERSGGSTNTWSTVVGGDNALWFG